MDTRPLAANRAPRDEGVRFSALAHEDEDHQGGHGDHDDGHRDQQSRSTHATCVRGTGVAVMHVEPAALWRSLPVVLRS